MSTLAVAPSESETPVQQRSPSPVRRTQTNNNLQNRQSRQRQRPHFLKRLHFKVLDSTQVMLDHVQSQTQGIIFPILDLDLLQDHFPDQDLEIPFNQLNVTIVTAWVIQQTIVSDARIEIFHADNLIRVEEITYRNFKEISQ